MFVDWPLMRFELTTDMEIDAGSLVMKKLALTGVRVPDVAVTVTAPDEAPAVTVAEATPDVLVVTLAEVPELKLARVAPDVIVRVTGQPNAAFPVVSRTVTLTVVGLAIGIVSGLIAMVILAGVGGGGVPICNVALLVNEPSFAVISTKVLPAFAVYVTEALPEASVVAVVADNDPAEPTLVAKETVWPLIGPDASVT
jgi:hypothetical protein